MKIILFLLLVSIYPVAYSETLTIQAHIINESYSKNVEVSGEYLVGMQLKSKNKSKNLHIFLPKNSTGNLCIFLSSIDGKYKAKLELTILEPIEGFVKVKFDSTYKNIFNEYSNEELAILANLKKSCNDYRPGKRLISSWGNKTTDELVLLIRSDARKDIAYIPNKRKYTIKSKCKKIRKKNSITYDKICILSGIKIGSISEIEIYRKNLQPINPEVITLY